MRTWLKSLLACVLGGAANAALLTVVDPNLVKPEDLIHIVKAFGAGAVISVLAYLKQSPLPPSPPPA